jgi:hypothetical protein
VASAPADAVLRIRITGELDVDHLRVLRAGHVRSFTPDTMNLEIRAGEGAPFRRSVSSGRGGRQSGTPRASGEYEPQLDLGFAL